MPLLVYYPRVNASPQPWGLLHASIILSDSLSWHAAAMISVDVGTPVSLKSVLLSRLLRS